MVDHPRTWSSPDEHHPVVTGLSPDARVLALVPHHACRDWLAGTIESLLAQTRPLDGIVVIDDASDDPPLDIVARYEHVTLLRADENVGPYRLIQQVIDETVHDALLFQDADDWSAPDRLERLLLASSRTGAELVGSDYVLVDTQRWAARRMLFPLDANGALDAHPTGHAQQHPAGLVARTLVDRLGGYATGMRFSGDDEFLRRAAHVAKVVNVPRPLYYRRHRIESLTTSDRTGHGSPARRAVLDEMSERAQANVSAVAAGRQPDLTPLRTRDAVRLRHLSGPTLAQLNTRTRSELAGYPSRPEPERVRRTSPLETPSATAPQVLVVGAPGAGADAVACALAQHPAMAFAGDVSWTAEVGASIAAAVRLQDDSTVLVPGTRAGTQVDGLAADAGTLSRLIGPSLDAVIIGGGFADPGTPDGAGSEDVTVLRRIASLPLTAARRWVGTVSPDRATLDRVLAVFPGAHVVHVVRDVDEVAHGAEGDDLAGPEKVAADWTAGVEVLLDLEAAVAPRVQRIRLLDVLADADAVLASCLAALGEDHHPAVSHPFDAAEPIVDVPRHPAVPRSARRLSGAIVGPVRTTPDRTRLTDPGAGAEVAPTSAPERSAKPGSTRSSATGQEDRRTRRATPMRRRQRTHPSVPSAVDLVDSHVPGSATVAVVSRGDDALLRFRATGRHLPATADGRYAGHHPADDGEAIQHLEAARAEGARFLLLPSTSRWWFDHYPRFAEHVTRTSRHVTEAEGHTLFELTAAADVPDGDHTAASQTAGEQYAQTRTDGDRTTDGPARRPGAVPSTTAPTARRRRKIHVVSWSVSHNPFGRAHLLADVLARDHDVELVGATFDHFGGGTWKPLADQELPLRIIEGGSLAELLPRMEQMAETLDGDAVIVSKPRLPGLGLAMLAKTLRGVPLILDVDDHELAFVGASTGLTLPELQNLSGSSALLNPFGGPWTRYCDHLIGSADAVTVSNATLQDRYGGTIVGHARDESVFDPARWDRSAIRAGFGFQPDDRVVLFGGTPRRHKGILDIAAALRRIGDPRLKLCLIETAELADLADDLAEYAGLIHTVPYQAMRDLPALVVAADLVCVLQDPASPVAHYQIPAKVTDALAMQVPCLTTTVPPLADLAETGALNLVDGPLHDAIEAVFDDYPAAMARAAVGRDVFLERLSYAAVGPTLHSIVEAAIAAPRPAPAEYDQAMEFARSVAGDSAGVNGSAVPAAHRGARPSVQTANGTDVTSRVSVPPPTYDVVMFWKQNDTGVYGRRHDMLLEQMARSPRVRRIVQFDHPIGISTLRRFADDSPTSHGRLLHDETMRRVEGRADDPEGKVIRRTFVYENRARDDTERLARPHPPKDTHLDFVRATLAQLGVGTGEHPTILWGYPKNFDLPDLIDATGPDLVVMDVVDDHRTWRENHLEQDEIARHYADVLSRADLTLTNCAPMTAEMEALSTRVHLVPNGCQWPPPTGGGPVPEALKGLEGPIIGYVGNLSSRIDVDLLDTLARERPDWHVVLVGSTHAGREALHLDIHPNVHLVGPRRAEDARRFMDHFDVAIIPHVDDEMTRRMHPLKAFVYCSAGVPVVSTAIDNLDELGDLVRIAANPEAFIAQVDAALAQGRRPLTTRAIDMLAQHAWTARMASIERLIDDAWSRRRASEPASVLEMA